MLALRLSGKQLKSWNRVFDALTSAVERAAIGLEKCLDEESEDATKECALEISRISKEMMRARPGQFLSDGEQSVLEIEMKFEQLKLAQEKRKQERIETRGKNLEFWEERLAKALQLLGQLNTHCVRDSAGNVTLLLTNQLMADFYSDIQSLVFLTEEPGATES